MPLTQSAGIISYNNDQELKLHIFQGYGLDPNVYGHSLDDSVISNTSFSSDYYDPTQFGPPPFFSDLMPKTLPDSSWVVNSPPAQTHHISEREHEQSPPQDQQQALHDSPVQEPARLPNNPIPNRAQTPTPYRNLPNYLTARRRSLSADNIHAMAKAQTTHENTLYAGEIPGSHNNMMLDDARVIDSNGDLHPHPHSLASRARMFNDSSINHTQKLNERQARFKVKLERRPSRNVPNNIQVPNTGIVMNQPGTMPINLVLTGAGGENAAFSGIPGMEIPIGKPSNPRRGGHMRKRSLSAPTQPFANPQLAGGSNGGIPSLQPAPSFPFNISSVSPSFRRPGALPIQIQRNHKHNHPSAPISSEEYQRKLDEELVRIDFDDITVSELKDMLRQRGKPATGKKAVLMQRLQEDSSNSINSPKTTINTSNIPNNQYNQILSSPTSPSGMSLHRSISNLHISSPPAYPRRFSPYGSVSIPNSPRMIPVGMGNTRATSNYNNGGFGFPEGVDEWHFKNVGIVRHPSYGSQQLAQMEENNAMFSQMILMEHQQQQQQQATPQPQQHDDYFGMQQPSSAPPTTTEFDAFQEQPTSSATTTNEFAAFQQPPSSAPPMRTEFVNNTYEFMRTNQVSTIEVPIGINEEMMRMDLSDTATAGGLSPPASTTADTIMVKQESDDVAKELEGQSSYTGLQGLGFDFEQDDQILVKFDQSQTGFMPMTNGSTSQQLDLQMQLEHQDEMFY
ncbi:10498_t:CDS:2 [Ambispora gerdemannii]|uniref:10498_t:CDS:1 n=1 Tax=Ambispora gerdemannii TaxID=144530 RepID=A0A9N8V754_9GLOM|nr:10498_t:CDS:2 [Ambispora gerdemannii]